jgi:hypothetical protein
VGTWTCPVACRRIRVPPTHHLLVTSGRQQDGATRSAGVGGPQPAAGTAAAPRRALPRDLVGSDAMFARAGGASASTTDIARHEMKRER